MFGWFLIAVVAFNVLPIYSQECPYKTIAGLPVTYAGDDGPVALAQFNRPSAVAIGKDGVIYVADTANNRVRRVDSDGVVRLVAGIGEAAFRGDGGTALRAALRDPAGLAVAADGTLYIADTWNHRVRRVSTDGIIQTVAGRGKALFDGDGGPAIAAGLNRPTRLALDRTGALYILDFGNKRIRRVDAKGVIQTVAGASPLSDYQPDAEVDAEEGSLATDSPTLDPQSFGVADDGTMYIGNRWGIWKVGSDGILTRWLAFRIGGPEPMLEEPASLARLAVSGGTMVVLPDGTLYLQTFQQMLEVRQGVATPRSIFLGWGFAADLNGDVVTVSNLALIRQSRGGSQTTLWEWTPPGSTPRNALATTLFPTAAAIGPDGRVYVAETNRILLLNRDGQLVVFAGNQAGSSEEGVPALNGFFTAIRSLAVDSNGAVYLAEGSRIRRIGLDGLVRTVFTAPGPVATVRVDARNRLYIFVAARGLSQVMRIDPDGTATVLMRDTPGSGFYWTGVSSAETAPGMAVAPDGSVNIAITGGLPNNPSSILGIPPSGVPAGQQPRVLPMERSFYSAAMTLGGDGSLYLGGYFGSIKKLLPDGTMMTVRNRDNLGFYGERGFDSAPMPISRIRDMSYHPALGLLVVDSHGVRAIPLPCIQSPGPVITGVLESATSNPNLRFAAGQLVSLYGIRLGPVEPLLAAPSVDGRFPTEVDGTRVLIDGVAAPLVFVSEKQVNAIVPFSADSQGSVPLEIRRNEQRSDIESLWMGRVGPALISAPGPPGSAALYVRMVNQDGSINALDKPAKLGSVVTVYASGLGATAPAGEDGKVTGAILKRPVAPVEITVEGQEAEVLYAGAAPGLVEGVMQINFRLPGSLPGRGGTSASVGIGVSQGVPQPTRLWFYFSQ